MVYTNVIDFDHTYDPLHAIITLDTIVFPTEKKVVEFDIAGVKKVSTPFILMQNGDLYFYGDYEFYKSYLHDNRYKKNSGYPPYPIHVKEYSNIHDIDCYDDYFTIIFQDGTVKMNMSPSEYDEDNDDMIDIEFPERILSTTTNSMQFLFLGESGNVYTIGADLNNHRDENEEDPEFMFFYHLGFEREVETIYAPTKIEGIQNIVYMYINEYAAFFIDKDGNVYGCGRNRHGIVDPQKKKPYNNLNVRLQPLPYLKNIIQIAAGSSEFSLFLHRDGTVFCNGNYEGAVLDGIGKDIKYQQLPDIKDAILISSSYGFFVYITANGNIYFTGKIYRNGLISQDIHKNLQL